MKKVLEIREYKFDDGINLLVELNRHTRRVGFVQHNGNGNYGPTTFRFDGRELKYMNGWKNILTAMQYVIDDVKKTMEDWETEELESLISIFEALGDDKSTKL